MNIKIIRGDITKIKADAIVNAANRSLLGGGGVDRAIHEAAGPQLLGECRLLGGCEIGQAKITKGYNLPAKYVIHTVGPVWNGGGDSKKELLAECYRSCFKLVREHHITSISFPSISTGAFGFPIKEASRVALTETKKYLDNNFNLLEEIIFVLFSDEDLEVYQKQYQKIFNAH